MNKPLRICSLAGHLLVSSLALLAGCADDTDDDDALERRHESPREQHRSVGRTQLNNECVATEEDGTGAPGEACTSYEDCAPVCCACGDGSSVSTAACLDGVCASESSTCTLDDPEVCEPPSEPSFAHGERADGNESESLEDQE